MFIALEADSLRSSGAAWVACLIDSIIHDEQQLYTGTPLQCDTPVA